MMEAIANSLTRPKHMAEHNWEVFNIIRFDSFGNVNEKKETNKITAEFHTICCMCWLACICVCVSCIHELHDSNFMSNYFTTFLSLSESKSSKKYKLIENKTKQKDARP